MQVDVVVIGAGPAGVSAAVHLHRAGRHVAVIDKASFPRDKICGDGLTASALRELVDLGLDPTGLPSWRRIDHVWVRSPSGHSVDFPMPVGRGEYAAVVRRNELDAALVDLARAQGVVIHERTPLDSIEQHATGVVIRSGDLEIEASYVIAADGMWSRTRKLLDAGTEGYLGDWHAFRQYVRDVTGPAKDDIQICFEPDFLPGYFWAFPMGDGAVNIGFGITRGGAHSTQDMKALWPDLLARPHIRDLLGPDAVAEGPHRAWPIPARIDEVTASSGRTLFVGDAVAACDPMSGEGIGQALLTGRFAADAIVATGSDPAKVRARYEQILDRSLRPDHKMSLLLIRALRHRKGARSAVRVAGASAWTRRNFGRWLFEDYPRAILVTPRRWTRTMFSQPGARFARAREPSPTVTRGSTRTSPPTP